MRATTPAPSLGDWPVDGLERVDRCAACASAERSLLYGGVTARSYMCAAGRWNVFRCGECASAFLDLRPTRETVHLAYGNYYEGATTPAAVDHRRRLRHIRRAIRNGYLNARYGYRLTRASRLGRMVVPLVPRQREMADEHIRHLRWRPGRPRLLRRNEIEPAALRGSDRAGWSFRLSRAIAHGEPPVRKPRPLSFPSMREPFWPTCVVASGRSAPTLS